ncbi:MAG: hypothetical protein ACREVR_08470 [Burkholderiales bacterium]
MGTDLAGLGRRQCRAGRMVQHPTVKRIAMSVSGHHPENIGARKIKEFVEARWNSELAVQVFTDARIGDQRTRFSLCRGHALIKSKAKSD